MTNPVDPIEVALIVGRTLDALGIPHTIGGSIAASFAGEPRATIDIDIVAALPEDRIADVVSSLGGEFYIDAGALLRAVQQKTSANLVHQSTSCTSIRRKTSFCRSCGG